MAEAPKRREPTVIRPRLEVYEPEHLEPIYANLIHLAASETEVILTFLQAVPPATLGQGDGPALSSIKARAVAKILVSPKAIEAFAKNLAEYMAGYKQKGS